MTALVVGPLEGVLKRRMSMFEISIIGHDAIFPGHKQYL